MCSAMGIRWRLTARGNLTPPKAKAQEIPLPYWSRLQNGETIDDGGKIYTPDMVLGPPRKGLKLTYTTDTRPTNPSGVAPKAPTSYL